MERAWSVASILCLIVAAVLLLRGNYDGAFVSATLGVVAWLLNYRTRLRGSTAPTVIDDEQDEAETLDEE